MKKIYGEIIKEKIGNRCPSLEKRYNPSNIKVYSVFFKKYLSKNVYKPSNIKGFDVFSQITVKGRNTRSLETRSTVDI